MLRVEIEGGKEFEKAVKALKKRADGSLEKWLADGAITTQSLAQQSILSRLSKGKIYERKGIQHTASAPGNPPNSDSGALVSNITVEKIKGGYDVGSRKGAPWGLFLEFGTVKMLPRPWLTPAYEKAVAQLMEYFKRAKI